MNFFEKNINFVQETHAIAQTKCILILIKNTFVINEYLTLFWCPEDVRCRLHTPYKGTTPARLAEYK